MDAAAKPPWTGLRRLPQPDPPRQTTECPLLLLLLLLPLLRLVAGAGRSPAEHPLLLRIAGDVDIGRGRQRNVPLRQYLQ
ncbi:Uncharacterised protein [Acinetobacter baumannii]|nr:Uncharacterised protein [Acinetobacter baumannii]